MSLRAPTGATLVALVVAIAFLAGGAGSLLDMTSHHEQAIHLSVELQTGTNAGVDTCGTSDSPGSRRESARC